MNKFARHFLPLSLRVRFLLATAGVVLVLSLAYGIVALVGYSVSFDKTTFRLLRGESNLFYTLAKWENNKISVELPENLDMQSPTMTLIYDETGKLLWTQRNIPWLIKSIQPEWLKTNGFHEIETNVDATSTLLSEDHSAQEKLKEVREDDDDAEMTHSVAVNIYPATARMPQLTIGGRYHSDRTKTLLYGVELVRIRAGRQFTVSHSFTVDRRLVELTPYRGAGTGSPRA